MNNDDFMLIENHKVLFFDGVVLIVIEFGLCARTSLCQRAQLSVAIQELCVQCQTTKLAFQVSLYM